MVAGGGDSPENQCREEEEVMAPISGILPAALRQAAAGAARNVRARPLERTDEAERARQSEPAREARRRPRMDEYVPAEEAAPAGRYWMERDENGSPKIRFDDPERAAERAGAPEQANPGSPVKANPAAPANAEPASPEKAPASGKKAPGKPEEKSERCVGNTDQVDREIERLRQKRERLQQQLNAEPDEARKAKLEQQLRQVDGELRQKDNDTYRRQHTQLSFSEG